MTGALAALQAKASYALEEAGLVVGTSAGSVLAAALRCGCSVSDLVAHQMGETTGVLSTICAPDLGCKPLPPLPALRVGSPRLILRALRRPWRAHPWVVGAACLPQGRAEHWALRSLVNALLANGRDLSLGCRDAAAGTTHSTRPARPYREPAGPALAWAAEDRSWITAVDYDSGRRVVFGREDAPPASLADAVVASCSVPGWYKPAVISGHRYIDGGVRSGTNADLLAHTGLAQAYVLAPAASLVSDSPRHPGERLERYIRRKMTGTLMREVALLREQGIHATILTPGPEDLAVMGGNLMDGRRREAVFETSLRTCSAALGE